MSGDQQIAWRMRDEKLARNIAETMRLSLSWLAKARMRGDGPPYAKFGRAIRYSENGLANYTRSRLRLSTSER
jgi:hypothetical protein